MVTISETEYKIFTDYLRLKSKWRTAEANDCGTRHVSNVLNRMIQKGILGKAGDVHYQTYAVEYKVKPKGLKTKKKKERAKHMRVRPSAWMLEMVPPHVTEDQKLYITGHYNKMPRSRLAEKVGLSKVDLNNTIMGMGLRKYEERDDYAEAN